MRSGFKSCALEPLLTGLCIDMMYAVASYLCRGIEAVITGLTRNQFVDNTTRGFESLPLRQRKQTPIFGCLFSFFWHIGRGFSPCAVRRRVRIRCEAGVELARKLQARASSHSEYPSISTHSLWVSVFVSLRGRSSPLRRQAQGSHLSEAIGVAKRRESVRKQLSVVFPRA